MNQCNIKKLIIGILLWAGVAAVQADCVAEYTPGTGLESGRLEIPCLRVSGSEDALSAGLRQEGGKFAVDAVVLKPEAVWVEPSSVYDGDTFRTTIPDWPVFFDNIRIRLADIDTPEIKGQCDAEKNAAYAARDRLSELLHGALNVELRNMSQGTYFRVIAEVYVDGVAVAQTLIDEGHAVAYDGGSRDKMYWCDTLLSPDATNASQ
ncbi:thermonuclease family protein [Candidatus Venteria ishoeyi]|uniref:TNase-like domain-containing protein n=1 Tax=Candidatus Venteria ishoeyi TaxID=1899563 RepID=A0A1H6F2J8_9GAMM|nr:thermonuclease family protein [Candidatus Venteria ishoeyi]SEH04388.1 Uncharacterised protein [Candidatus Venteria ishoeyi]